MAGHSSPYQGSDLPCELGWLPTITTWSRDIESNSHWLITSNKTQVFSMLFIAVWFLAGNKHKVIYGNVWLHDCNKLSIQKYGINDYHKLAIIWTREWFACFQRTKSCMIANKSYIGTEYGEDYANPGDDYSLFGFSYIEEVAPGSILSTISTLESLFLDN